MRAALAGSLRRHRSLILLLISTVLAQLAVNLSSSWLEQTIGTTPLRLLEVTLFVILVALLLWVMVRVAGPPPPVEVVRPDEGPEKHPGLIALVGTPRGVATEDMVHEHAIRYHLGTTANPGPLKVCWLVASGGPTGSMPVALETKKRYEQPGLLCCTVNVREVKDAFDLNETYQIVKVIYEEELRAHGLQPEQVIADFTAATTPMSVGMALACGQDRPMEYWEGRPPIIASAPVLVRFKGAGG